MKITNRVERLALMFNTSPPPIEYINSPDANPVRLVATSLLFGSALQRLTGAILMAIYKDRLKVFYVHEELVKKTIEMFEPTQGIQYSEQLLEDLLIHLIKIPAFRCINPSLGQYMVVDKDILAEFVLRDFDVGLTTGHVPN